MVRVSGTRLRWAFVVGLLLLPSATAAGADSLVVQHIGDLSGNIAEAVASEVAMVPFPSDLDARTTPILLAAGKAFVRPDGKRIAGLRPAERRAIRQAYEAGQVILLLDASTHDVEALHLLLDDGVTHESGTDPVVLAYALRQENRIATARLVAHPSAEDDVAWSRALEIVLAELTGSPAARQDDAAAGPGDDWADSPVQKFIITSTDKGTFNTPIAVYALHSCQENKDYYLVNTGGTWTAEDARYQSANTREGQIRLLQNGSLDIRWQPGRDGNCELGNTSLSNKKICGYFDYPRNYEIAIEPPPQPTNVVQLHAAPAGTQGRSASYQSGFSFSIGGGVNVSGQGPSGGIRAGVAWNNSVSTTVPPLVVEAGNKGNQGTFTRYAYCTVGDTFQDCRSTIQMVGQKFLCERFIVGDPQNGQTPNGRLSNVAQTVLWQADPGTYTGETFDVTVTFRVDLATSTSKLWWGYFDHEEALGPRGYCNSSGCSCSIDTEATPQTLSHTFKVPFPSRLCPS